MSLDKAKAFDKMSILFDFDGTIGDTETPAMEVAFWELAPYLPDTRESMGLVSPSSSVVVLTAANCCLCTFLSRWAGHQND